MDTAEDSKIAEAGKAISARNRQIIEDIKAGASKLAYHPQAQQIVALAEQLLALPIEEAALQERDFTAEQRKMLADKGFALPDGSYPIETKGDLENAIRAIGRASDPERVKRHIIQRARAMGAMDMLPPDWPGSTQKVKEAADYPGMMPAGPADMTGKKACPNCGMAMDTTAASCPGCGANMRSTAHLLASAMRESVQFIEAVAGAEGREWDVILIQAGQSKNGRFYPPAVLEAAVPLFEGVAAFADHATDAERQAKPERSIRDKVGTFSAAQYGQFPVPSGRVIEGVKARFKVIAPWLRETLVEAIQAGLPNFLGFSIDAEGRVGKKQQDGRLVDWVEAITRVHSVDVVTDAAAGGQVMRLVASTRKESEMNEQELARIIQEQVSAALAAAAQPAAAVVAQHEEVLKEIAALKEAARKQEGLTRLNEALGAAATLSEVSKLRIRADFTDLLERRDFTADELAGRIKETTEYEAAVAQQFINPTASTIARFQVGDSRHDKLDKMLHGWFAGEDIDGVPRAKSLQEAFCRWEGVESWDFDLVDMADKMGGRYDSRRDHKRIRESLTTAGWDAVFADNLYIMMMKGYQASPYYDRWRLVVSEIESVPDFQTRHWVRIGGYGDLSTVSEGATYPNATSPTDEAVAYALAKRGMLDDVTIETLTGNDRTQKVRKIPVAMGRAAARTLFKYVMNFVTTDNPTLDYDTTALYDSTHGNTGTTALTVSGLNVTVIAMRDQTAYNESSEILGPRTFPKFLIVPNELEMRANRIVNPSPAYGYGLNTTGNTDADTSIDPQAYAGKGIQVLVYDQLTDATDWWAVADPQQMDTMVMGFLNGQTEPELFVQDQPNVGSAFTADKVTWKIRHIYAGDILEHRSFYRQVVAG